MKPFKFTLEAVLTVREMEEEKALEAYGMSMRKIEQIKNQLTESRKTILKMSQTMARLREARFNPQLQNGFILALRQQETHEQKLVNSLKKAEKEKDNSLQAYLKARRNREIIDRLKEKSREKHEKEALRKEEIEMEDLAINTRHFLNNQL